MIYIDDGSLAGYSTQARVSAEDDNRVSYASLKLLDLSSIHRLLDVEQTVNLTRAYTNPINGRQSIAFMNRVTLREEDAERTALLLRVVPVSMFEQEWVFPTAAYANAEISMIDTAGNYIIKDRSFKNASFFEFYISYNETDPAGLAAMEQSVVTQTGSLRMNNSKGQDCLVAHAPVSSTENWAIVTMIRMDDLVERSADWRLVGTVSAGLLLLFLFDLLVLQGFNRRLAAVAAEARRRAGPRRTSCPPCPKTSAPP